MSKTANIKQPKKVGIKVLILLVNESNSMMSAVSSLQFLYNLNDDSFKEITKGDRILVKVAREFSAYLCRNAQVSTILFHNPSKELYHGCLDSIHGLTAQDALQIASQALECANKLTFFYNVEFFVEASLIRV